jgi:translation initiation factor 2 beta subunit (eIF-2beta)/eIF-5
MKLWTRNNSSYLFKKILLKGYVITQNVDGSDDIFYRYKMPSIEISQRKNNRTYVTNMKDVAKSLERDPEQPCLPQIR